jgi:hypothetical protein
MEAAQAARHEAFFCLLKSGCVAAGVRDPLTGNLAPIPPEAWMAAQCPERLLFTRDGAISDFGEGARITTMEGAGLRPFAGRAVFLNEAQLSRNLASGSPDCGTNQHQPAPPPAGGPRKPGPQAFDAHIDEHARKVLPPDGSIPSGMSKKEARGMIIVSMRTSQPAGHRKKIPSDRTFRRRGY